MWDGIEHPPHTWEDAHGAIDARRLDLPCLKYFYLRLVVGIGLNGLNNFVVLGDGLILKQGFRLLVNVDPSRHAKHIEETAPE